MGSAPVPFSHASWFGPLRWKTQLDREYRLGPIAPDADLRAIGARIQKENGLQGYFNVFRTPQGKVQLYRGGFLSVTRAVYDPVRQRLTVEKDIPRWHNVLQRLHTRGGFQQPGLLSTLWSVIVDIVQVAILVWLASGLYMWWSLNRMRRWGYLALGAGSGLFALFMLKL